MQEENNEYWAIIAAVLEGTASEKDKQLLEAWIAESDENKKTFLYLSRLKYPQLLNQQIPSKEGLFHRLQQRMQDYKYQKTIALWRYVAAASVALLIGLGSWNLFHGSFVDEKESIVETKTLPGIHSKVMLSDGTVVYLNASSSLTYPTTFKGEFRKVKLQGEAYFDVSKDKKHPFIVNASALNIQVLGTHFNVKAYDDDQQITATLLEGAILVHEAGDEQRMKPVVLAPNDQVVYQKASGLLQVSKVDAVSYTIWREGQFYFQKERFYDIAKQLERTFHVKISIHSPQLMQKQYSGQFDHGENLTQILDLIKQHRDFKYKISKDSIEIY